MVKPLFDTLQASAIPGNVLSPQSILELALKVFGLYLLGGVCRYFHLYKMNFTGERVIQTLRHRLQQKFMRLNLSFHNNYSSGSGGLISRTMNDLFVVQNGLRMFADFFREPVLLIFLLGYLFYLKWKLTVIIFFVLPVILYFLKVISKTIKTHSIKGQQDLEIITGTLKESLDGVRIIQSFNLEQEMANRFGRQSETYLDSRKKIHQRVELSGPVTEFIASALVLTIYYFVALEISQGLATTGDFVSYLTALILLGPPIKKLQESYVRIQETSASAQRVFQILDEDSEVPQSPLALAFPRDWKKIEYKNVSFRYGHEPIIKNLNLTINRGEIVAFVGASGSGKSTIVNLLGRFFDPTSGTIEIDGVNISHMSLKDLRHHIALVTQDVFLFSDTIENNIWAGDFQKSKDGVVPAAKSANAHTFIEKMPKGYQSSVGDRGNLLSGGEKQRISIARALFKDSPILILDEATSALDSVSEIEVQKGLDHLMEGRTALVIAHRLSTVAKADRIVVLRAGEIVEMGSHAELLEKKSEYWKLYELQYNHT
jgi:ATP-binding cassette subfamily B protein/subfamily B ATP-binding cassette protein MsbA